MNYCYYIQIRQQILCDFPKIIIKTKKQYNIQYLTQLTYSVY